MVSDKQQRSPKNTTKIHAKLKSKPKSKSKIVDKTEKQTNKKIKDKDEQKRVSKKKPKPKTNLGDEMSNVHKPIASHIRDHLNKQIKVFHSCPVGSWCPNNKSKQVCYQNGWPDICVIKRVQSKYAPDGFFSGLAMECKNGEKGLAHTSKEHMDRQKQRLYDLKQEGFCAGFVLTKEAGLKLLEIYLDSNKHHLLPVALYSNIVQVVDSEDEDENQT